MWASLCRMHLLLVRIYIHTIECEAKYGKDTVPDTHSHKKSIFVHPSSTRAGYNLDYNEAFRELPHICIISKDGIDHFKSHPVLSGLL
jgi:hypothetical protein